MPTSSEIYPISVLLLSFLLAGWLLSRHCPLADDDHGRDTQLDGLRALLAFGVMVYHFFGIRMIVVGETPFKNLSEITRLLGSFTVCTFFSITAYLFSQRLLRSESHQGRLILKFLLGRCFRLIPTAMLAAILFLLANTRVYTDTQRVRLLVQNWTSLLNVAFSSISHPATGPDSQLLEPWAWGIACGPHWTLHYEWIFYLTLASISLLALKRQALLVPLSLIFLLTFVIQGTNYFFVKWEHMTWAFVPGMILGLTKRYWIDNRYLSHPLCSVVAMIAVLLSAYYRIPVVKVLVTTLFLACIICNNPATKFLNMKLLRSLGETTYSVYLLHGLVQYATFKWFLPISVASSIPPWMWWMTCGVQVVVIVFLARLSFEFVEKPGIALGKRFYLWLMNAITRRVPFMLSWI